MEKLHTFKSFSQVREEAAKIKQLKEISNKQAKSIEKYNSLLKEYGIASPGELEEEKRNEFFSRMVESIDLAFSLHESTRAQIGVIDKSGKITSTYVHYGDIAEAGDFLRNNGGKEAKELLKLGKAGISFLGHKITPKNDFANPDYNAACFYGRDRGESGNYIMNGKIDDLKKYVNTAKNRSSAEYIYLWDEATSKWLYMDAYEDENLQVFESNTSFDLNEAISRSSVNRMNGLVPLKEMKQLLDIAGVIIQDFTENEGFEFQDCVDYLAFRIADEWEGVYEGKASEGNAFGAAVTKAKEENKDEFEFQGKTFKVTEAEEILEARSINKIQNEWTKVTAEMAELAKEWKAAEGDAKTALLNKLKEKTATKKSLEKELDTAVAGKDKDLELAVESVSMNNLDWGKTTAERNANLDKYHSLKTEKEKEEFLKKLKESLAVSESKEYEEADNIFQDLMGEYTMDELHGMSMGDAIDTVKSYGHTGAKAKKIADALYQICNESNGVNEAFEVHYSDGIRAMKKFNNQSQAMSFAKDLIKNKKGLQFVDVFNAGPGFHSTADTDAIIAFWGDGSYTDNVAKKDTKLAAKKITESVINEANTVKDEAISRLADFFRVSRNSLSKFNFDGKDDIKALTKALNSTSDQGTEMYYKMAIKLAKEELGVDESIDLKEAEINSDEEFTDYAHEVLKKAFGEEYDETKAEETIKGVLAKADGDYGAAIGMLTSGLGE